MYYDIINNRQGGEQMAKVARSFRLEEKTVQRIKELQDYYTEQTGFSFSQADVIQKLVNEACQSLDAKKKE